MRVVGVTGGCGFIGSYVERELLHRGYGVAVMDRYDKRGSLDGQLDPRTKFFLGDVRDSVAMTEFAAHVDGIIHLAAVLGTQETIGNPRPSAEVNVMGGLNFLEACAQYRIPGANICVGNRGMFATYSLTKSLVEDFCTMFNRYRGSKINQVRAMNAYGPGQSVAAPYGPSKVRKITPSFVMRALHGHDVEIYGDGSQVSDMVYVGDVAKALVSSLEKAAEGDVFDTVIEVGPVVSATVREVAELIIRLSGSSSKIVNLPMRPGETPGAVVSAKTETLWRCGINPQSLVGLEAGMLRTINYYRSLIKA